MLLRTARSLKLGVPSLRDRSGRSAYGLLRCTSSRCVWLRQTVAALPRPDQSLHSAFRRRPWIKIKSRRADTRPNGGHLHCGSELAREGGLTADQSLADSTRFNGRSEPARDSGLTGNASLPAVLRSPVGASLLAKASGQSIMNCLTHRIREQAHSHLDRIPIPECLKVVSNLRNLPTRFSGCPSDVRSLACVRRCQFSDRDWKPRREPSAFALFMTYACAPLLCALRYGGCARETFGSTGFSVPRVSSLRTAATYSFGNRMGQLHFRIGESP